MVYKKPTLRLVTSDYIQEYEEEKMKNLRTPIGNFCLSLTRKPKPVKDGAPFKSSLSTLFASIHSLPEKEGVPFGELKGTLAEMCESVYSSFAGFFPSKSPGDQAEQDLLKSGWTQEQIQEVRVLEMQMK